MPLQRQQGMDGAEAKTGSPYWPWARLLGRVCPLEMAPGLPPLCGRREPCDLPLCRRGALRSLAARPQASVRPRLLRPRQLASLPPARAPARGRHARCAFAAATTHGVAASATGAQRRGSAPLGAWPSLPQRSPTGRPEARAPGNPCVRRLTPPPVQTAPCCATPYCGARWPAPLSAGNAASAASKRPGGQSENAVSFSYPSRSREEILSGKLGTPLSV